MKINSHSRISFSILLASILAFSGIFFTYAYATEAETAKPEEVHFETSVVANALTFIAEHGTEDSSNNNAGEGDQNEDDESESTSDMTEETIDFKRMSSEPAEPVCPVSEGQSKLPITLVISKIVCTDESDLPNWGQGGPDITAQTATDFLASHPSCRPLSHWGFQWGDQHVTNPGDDYLWGADVSTGWTVLGFTDENGVLTKQIDLPTGTTEVRVREKLEPGYIPFSYGLNGNTNTNNVSAEMYCADDVYNYDNFDFVRNPVGGMTYHCVAWNVRQSSINTPPVITLLGTTPLALSVGDIFVDPGATSTDKEDGILIPVVTGSVNTAVPGTYTVRYTATDSGGLSVFVERTVNVVPTGTKPACADGSDNDNDGVTDFPADLGCIDASDNDENDAPLITVLGANPMTVTLGSVFQDPGATSTDKEDGILIPVATGTVNVMATGTYSIVYTATDSKGLSATATRTVNVIPVGSSFECSDGLDNDLDGTVDFPSDAGCSSATDNDENNAPVITLLGANPITVIVGNSFTDPGATATDTEDGDITDDIVATGTVNTANVGTYTLSYNVKDSDGLAAPEVTRTVNVVSAPTTGGGGGGGTTPPRCANGQDDDADGKADYPLDPGCTDSLDNDETDTPSGGGGGGAGNGLGGGVGAPGLQIFNERLTVLTSSSVKVTWNTNLLADSRVVYGDISQTTLGAAPQYGYDNSTATNTVATSSHELVVTDLPENSVMFFRPVSSNGASTVVGVELVTPVVAGSCTYLEKYLRLGYDNDPVEVTKLQRFLKEYEGFTDLSVTGFFDIETDKAVRAFQDEYAQDVLEPWALPSNTGYVYYTTQKKVNEIYCQRAFPLNAAQLMEIDAYANMLRLALGTNDLSGSIMGTPTTRPTVTITPSVGTKSPAVDLSNIDLSNIAPTTPVTTLVPEEGEIASGVSTDTTTVNAGRISLKDLLASIRMGIFGKKNDTSLIGSTSAENLNPVATSSIVATVSGGLASTLGISTGAFWVWLILFIVILALGYTMARKNRQYF